MKLILILLACIAATNAASCYSYNYWYSRKFCVFPARSCYSFRVYYKSSWSSFKYYAPVLKVYPGEDCGKDGWSERTVAEVETEMSNALKESLLKITTEMAARKAEWVKCLSERIESYKTQYVTYITKYYAYYIECAKPEDKAALEKKRDDAINEYKERLNKCRDEAIQKYSDALAERVKCIQDYHKKLLDNARSCLTTRLAKIGEYSDAVQKKIDEYVKRFTDCHIAILDQKAKCYRALLDYLHGANFEPAKTDEVIGEFREKEMITINQLVGEYIASLADYKLKLVTYYRCAYRCYLSNGCLNFYKRGYYSSCRRLGCWYRYRTTYCIQKYGINKFVYRYRETRYCGKTCETMPVKTVPEITDPLKAKLVEIVKCATDQFTAWKTKWAKYHEEYVTKYKAIMEARHEWYIKYLTAHYVCVNNSEELTDEQKAKIAEVKAELAAQLKKCLDEYAAKLLASLLECVAKFNESIEEYKTKVTEMITKIGTNYQTCLDTRTKKIGEYATKLADALAERKQKLVDDMVKCKNDWLQQRYQKMYIFYHGELTQKVIVLHNAHVDAIVAACNVIVDKCYTNWADINSRMVTSYACCYSCRAGRFCFPSYCFGGYYRWTVKYPTACYYPYYYKSYRRTYCYRVTYTKGYYRYC